MNSFYQTPSIRIRLSMVIGLFGVISIGMLGRSTYLQIWGDPKLENLARKQFQSHVRMNPRRGLIMDRTGEPLAINLETSSLAGSPAKILKSSSSLHLLARNLGVTSQALRKRLDPKKSFAWFERHVSEEQMARFKKTGIILPTGEMPEGLWLVKEMKRVYPHGELANSLLGTVNIDTAGIEGIELWKNSILRGKSASYDAFKDALGRPALIQASDQKIKDGENVELSIDASLQFSVEEALQGSMDKTRAQSGLVVVMDSNNGEILALAQSNANGNKGVKKVMAVTDGYEPGSTMKPLLLASALNKGVVKINDSLFGHYGKFTLQGRTIKEAEAHEKYGFINLKKMVEVSSNIVAAELSLKVGAERFLTSLKELGFGAKTGTGLPGEIGGWVPSPSQAKTIRPLTLATMGFGQSILVTPMQMLRAYASLSNGGFLVEPTLLKRKDNEVIKKLPVLKPEAVKGATEALLLVTEGDKGTGHKAHVEGYRVAGKTGTAQTVDSKTKRYSSSRYMASFIGFPVGVKQPVTILVLFDHPKGVYFGGETAAPLFSQVLKSVTSRFSIPSTEKIEIPTQLTMDKLDKQEVTMSPSSAEPVSISQSTESIKEVNLDHPVMPSVIGLTPQEAIRALKPFSPSIQVHGFGVIRRQIPDSGSILSPGIKVGLYLEE
jgi:cell division protein FtsI (penicillin-binding protein 3)